MLGLYAAITFSQAYTWEPLGSGLNNGTNDTTYAITSFNGEVIYGGNFTVAGGVAVNNIAAYNPATNTWRALGTGINGEVKALIVFGGQLYAGGEFTSPGNNIARWNGTSWSNAGSGTNGEVLAFTIYSGNLAVSGNFSTAGGINSKNVAGWTGSAWIGYSSGLSGSGDKVCALTVFAGNLVAGGRFDIGAGNNVAKWNGSSWSSFNSDNFDDDVQALEVFNSELHVGGKFNQIGGNDKDYIVKWNGSSWVSVGNGVDDGDVTSLEVYRNNLVVGGNFRVTGTGLYVDRIAVWTGTTWQRMLTGVNDRVYGLYSNAGDTALYAAGEFTTAGGKWCYFAAKWGIFETRTISGIVKFADNNLPVTKGKVKVLRYDVITREVIAVDSAIIDSVTGIYILSKVPRNDGLMRIIAFPDDELDNYVPTYYPSNLLWSQAGVVNPVNNLTGINVSVFRRNTTLQSSSAFGISGKVFLNILPPPVNLPAVPYLKNSIIYFKQNGSAKRFTVTDENQNYSIADLNPGTYEMTVTRFGYETEILNVTITNQNLVQNFYLDTMNVIGITGISTSTPKTYLLKQNYPNPFNPVTNIEFSIVNTEFVTLKVYNILGEEVKTLVNSNLETGTYKVDFDASNLPSGVYFYSITTGLFSETKKMILIK